MRMNVDCIDANYICDNIEEINRFYIINIQMKFVIFIEKYLWNKILT